MKHFHWSKSLQFDWFPLIFFQSAFLHKNFQYKSYEKSRYHYLYVPTRKFPRIPVWAGPIRFHPVPKNWRNFSEQFPKYTIANKWLKIAIKSCTLKKVQILLKIFDCYTFLLKKKNKTYKSFTKGTPYI